VAGDVPLAGVGDVAGAGGGIDGSKRPITLFPPNHNFPSGPNVMTLNNPGGNESGSA
jgi:hypothetical protein